MGLRVVEEACSLITSGLSRNHLHLNKTDRVGIDSLYFIPPGFTRGYFRYQPFSIL
jgi:hypothetical protein